MPTRLFWMSLLLLAHLVVTPPAWAQAKPGASLEICLAGAADYTPVYPTSVFPAGATKEVTAVVRLGRGESYPTMTATWIAVEVPGTRPNFMINKIDMDLKGKDRAAVRFNHPEGLLAGKYRLEGATGGRPWKSAEFSVTPLASPEVKQPGDLFPMNPGTVWRYTFTQEFGRNIRPRLPAGMKLAADGKLRASMTKTATKTDSVGTHIESRRNNELVEEEWWRLTDAGLVVAQMKSGDEVSTFDPPHPIWPWPLKTPREWSYEAPDKSFTQKFRMWGPVPIKGPPGTAQGYVVLMEQPSPSIALSVERHYLPGIGMVREVVVQARNGVMLTRWENVLTARP